MEILRKFKLATGALALLITIGVSPLFGQTFEATQQAFSKSYDYEKEGTYQKAIDELKNVYLADSYELNLRLGWLNYLQGQFTESSAYYQKAITLKPFSIEAKFGYVYPLAASGNWSLLKTQYLEILKIDPQNTLANYRLGLIYYNAGDFGKEGEALIVPQDCYYALGDNSANSRDSRCSAPINPQSAPNGAIQTPNNPQRP